MATFRAASAGNGGTDTLVNYSVTLPTGWQAGDLVLVQITIGALPTTGLNGLAGWTITHATDQNSGGATHTTGVAARIMQSGDTNPVFTGSGGGKWAWSAVAVQPAAGEALSIGADAAVKLTTTTSTTLAAPNSTTTTTTDVSILFYGLRASTSGATAINAAAPTGWTEGAESSTAVGTNNATRQVSSMVAYKNSAAGAQVPGTGTVNISVCQNAYHYRITGAVAPTPLAPPVTVVNDGALIQSHYW